MPATMAATGAIWVAVRTIFQSPMLAFSLDLYLHSDGRNWKYITQCWHDRIDVSSACQRCFYFLRSPFRRCFDDADASPVQTIDQDVRETLASLDVCHRQTLSRAAAIE